MELPMTDTEMDRAVSRIMGVISIIDGSAWALWTKEHVEMFVLLGINCHESDEFPGFYLARVPAFSQSLDASRWAVMTLSAELVMDDKAGMLTSERVQYMNLLERVVMRDTKVSACNFEFYNAMANQRTEAFLMVHGVLPKIL